VLKLEPALLDLRCEPIRLRARELGECSRSKQPLLFLEVSDLLIRIELNGLAGVPLRRTPSSVTHQYALRCVFMLGDHERTPDAAVLPRLLSELD
jgi:hypothetical protein